MAVSTRTSPDKAEQEALSIKNPEMKDELKVEASGDQTSKSDDVSSGNTVEHIVDDEPVVIDTEEKASENEEKIDEPTENVVAEDNKKRSSDENEDGQPPSKKLSPEKDVDLPDAVEN